jgi:hypothetical protein
MRVRGRLSDFDQILGPEPSFFNPLFLPSLYRREGLNLGPHLQVSSVYDNFGVQASRFSAADVLEHKSLKLAREIVE